MNDYTYSLSDVLEKKVRYNIYIWISEPTNGIKYPVKGKNIVYLSGNGQERGSIQGKRMITITQK